MLAALLGTAALGLLVSAVSNSSPNQQTVVWGEEHLQDVETGDVLFLRTTTWRGRVVQHLSRERAYTHVAVVVAIQPGEVLLAEASPAGRGLRGRAKLTPAGDLLRTPDISMIGIFRPQVSASARTAAAARAMEIADEARPFDEFFNTADESAVYCTELVWLAFRSHGLLPDWSGTDIIFPGDLLDSGFFQIVKSNDPAGAADWEAESDQPHVR